MKFKFYLTLLLVCLTFSVFSHEIEIDDKDIETIIKLRVKNMSTINSLSKKIYKNLDLTNIKNLSEDAIKLKHNILEFKELFPKNSIGGKASENIWEDKELFNKYIEIFLSDVDIMIQDIENRDLTLLNESFNKMTSNCGTCHKKFKSK